jgi:hypothetical protein
VEGTEIDEIRGRYLLLGCIVMVKTADGPVLIGRKFGLYFYCGSVNVMKDLTRT